MIESPASPALAETMGLRGAAEEVRGAEPASHAPPSGARVAPVPFGSPLSPVRRAWDDEADQDEPPWTEEEKLKAGHLEESLPYTCCVVFDFPGFGTKTPLSPNTLQKAVIEYQRDPNADAAKPNEPAAGPSSDKKASSVATDVTPLSSGKRAEEEGLQPSLDSPGQLQDGEDAEEAGGEVKVPRWMRNKGWEARVDEASGRGYYAHVASGLTSWRKPTGRFMAQVPFPCPNWPCSLCQLGLLSRLTSVADQCGGRGAPEGGQPPAAAHASWVGGEGGTGVREAFLRPSSLGGDAMGETGHRRSPADSSRRAAPKGDHSASCGDHGAGVPDDGDHWSGCRSSDACCSEFGAWGDFGSLGWV